jgi:ABC-type transport system involved in cytochrome bd biosynthesis fused ATPase/permease subunit
LTPKQVGSIQPVATKLQKEFDDELEMLKQKYRKRLMDKVMTKEEREIFGRAIGENIGSKSELEFGF